MKLENFELVELTEAELSLIEGGSHFKDFFEGVVCGLGIVAFLATVV
ncbi:hypothetical protein [Flavobacterium hungaricum]|nr:hypothetical protein [Flavobacterium hungaricum]